MHYYPYYPILPLHSSYLYPPPSNVHLHAQLTAIRHGQFLREQQQLQYLSRLHLDREKHYSNQVFEKEMRMANIIDSNMSHLMQERQMLEEQRINEEIRFQEEMKRLEREKYGIINEGRRSQGNEGTQQQQSFKKGKRKQGKQEFGSLGGEVFNIRPKDFSTNFKEKQVHQNENSRKKDYSQFYKRDKVRSIAKDISYNEANDSFLKNSNTKRSILKNPSFTHSPKLPKSKKVKFLKDSPQFQQAHSSSYCLNNSALKAAHGNHGNTKNPKDSASKKIKNRLKMSEIVFRDSQYRNVKHEIDHLANTYETECKLRKDLKTKINNKDDIIQKYSLVTSEAK